MEKKLSFRGEVLQKTFSKNGQRIGQRIMLDIIYLTQYNMTKDKRKRDGHVAEIRTVKA